MGLYYGRDGAPLSPEQWAEMRGEERLRVVARTTMADGVRVSTVWLGIDHQFGEGPPLIFETMVFGVTDEIQERYSTEAEAIAGHEQIVRKLVEAGSTIVSQE